MIVYIEKVMYGLVNFLCFRDNDIFLHFHNLICTQLAIQRWREIALFLRHKSIRFGEFLITPGFLQRTPTLYPMIIGLCIYLQR